MRTRGHQQRPSGTTIKYWFADVPLKEDRRARKTKEADLDLSWGSVKRELFGLS